MKILYRLGQSHLYKINGLVQDCGISITNALEISQFCTKPSKYHVSYRRVLHIAQNILHIVDEW